LRLKTSYFVGIKCNTRKLKHNFTLLYTFQGCYTTVLCVNLYHPDLILHLGFEPGGYAGCYVGGLLKLTKMGKEWK